MFAAAALALLLPTARADVATPPPNGKRFTTHAVEVKGLPDDMVLLAVDAGDPVSKVVVFHKDGKQALERGGRNRGGGLGKPRIVAMSRTAHAAWDDKARKEVARQQEACAKRGEGCAHISRFVPRIPAPSPVVDCGVTVDLQLEAPENGPDSFVQTITVKEATAGACTVEDGGVVGMKDGEPVKSGGCATVGGAASAAIGLAVLLGLARRRDKADDQQA